MATGTGRCRNQGYRHVSLCRQDFYDKDLKFVLNDYFTCNG